MDKVEQLLFKKMRQVILCTNDVLQTNINDATKGFSPSLSGNASSIVINIYNTTKIPMNKAIGQILEKASKNAKYLSLLNSKLALISRDGLESLSLKA